MTQTKLAVVVPCFNEEEILDYSFKKLSDLLNSLKLENLIDETSLIVFVDDGSKDRTWSIIEDLAGRNSCVAGVKLSRNCGHQNALLAGLFSIHKEADCTITIDADLQDDIDVIRDMILALNEGSKIVYGVRRERKTDTFFKKYTAQSFYKFIKFLGVEIIYNHADYRLASKEVIEALIKFKEVNLFLRGMFPLIGYKSTCVYYDRHERLAGESKYPLKKMIAFAFEGITSFSVKPLRIIALIGMFIFLVSIILALYSIYSYIFRDTVPGWTSIALPIYFISGIQLLSLGVIGEYIGKIYKETKERPRFIIEERV